MQRWDIINHFIKKNNYKSYLEIGYYKGWSFDRVECEDKTAVDPNPCKTPEQEGMPYETKEMNLIVKDKVTIFSSILYKYFSDDFFLNTPETTKWDIIFIDGLHEANQASRDLLNSLDHLNIGGAIIMHDCNPPTLKHTTTGDEVGNWNGNVYQAAIRMRMAFPYHFYVVDTDWGIGVLERKNTTYFPFILDSKDPYEVPWDNFDKGRQQLLNLISLEEFKQREKI